MELDEQYHKDLKELSNGPVNDKVKYYINLASTYKKYAMKIKNLEADIRDGELPTSTILQYNTQEGLCVLGRFKASKCRKFVKVSNAIKDLKEGEMVIFLSDYNLFGVFTVEQYYDFISDIKNEQYDEVKLKTRQIVLTGWPQKIVFMCNENRDVVMEVEKFVMQKFGKTIKTACDDSGQTTVIIDTEVENFEKVREAFEELIVFINEKAGFDEMNKMHLRTPPIVTQDQLLSYISHALPSIYKIAGITDLKSTVSGAVINITVNGDFNVNVVNNYNLPLPYDGQTTTDYYESVKGKMDNHMSHKDVVHEVSKMGFHVKKSCGIMKWRKNK
jgi:hypothetical protein